MDWYFGIGVDDLIVPKEDGGLSDRLPSPESWSKWGIGGPDYFPSPYKCGVFGAEFAAEEDGFEAISLSQEFEMEDSICDEYFDDLPNMTRPSIHEKDQCSEESIPSEQENMNRHSGNDEIYFEEAVLSDLQTVTSELSEKIRICFRDSLYRLAENSDQHRIAMNQQGDLFMDIPPVCALDAEMTRSGTKRSTESKSNVIDRAIASMMFKKMEFNVHNLPMGPSSNYNEDVIGASRPFNFKSSDSPIAPLDDAEVPIFGATANSRSMVLQFGSAGE